MGGPMPLILGVVLGVPHAEAATVDFECLPEPAGGRIVGVAPLSVHCEVIPPAEGSWADVSWTMGDGTVLHGESVSYRYLDPGQYTLSVALEDYEGPGVEEEGFTDPRRTRYGYVTICGKPEPAFTFVNHGDLDFETVNTTPVTVGCTDELRWELFHGRPDGDPERVWETWEPRFTLPEEGEYTLRLTMSGLGGTGAAELRFDAVHKLTDDLTEGPKALACATGGGGGGAWIGLGLLTLVRRRRG